MAKPSLILAALAADALPNLRFVQVQNLTLEGVEITVELLTTDTGRLILFKSPKNSLTTTELGTEVRALQALKALSLPFSISTYLGKTSASAIRSAVAFEYVPGSPIDLARLRVDDSLVSSIGRAISAIHSIPVSTVSNAGLPEYEPAERVRKLVARLDRAMETGKVPQPLLERWENALMDANLFKYQPLVVHGKLSGSVVLGQGKEVVGVTEWGGLSIDDPATDLAFIISEAGFDIFDATTLAYEGSTRADRNLKQRAHLYSELDLVRYLLEVLDSGDEEEISDAVHLLAMLNEELLAGNLPSLRPTNLAPISAEVIVPISHASSFTAPIVTVEEEIEIIDLAEQDSEPPIQESEPNKQDNELF
jgi:aminoglycoside phosphotransferase (APT) family kinase protein